VEEVAPSPEFAAGRGRVRLKDVAEAAGVNPSIASRVLNGDPTVSTRPETRSRIHAAALELGYTPNAFARGLKMRRTMTLGLVLPNLVSAVNNDLILGAERRAAAAGYVVLIADADEFEATGDVHRRLLLEHRVDGLLFASTLTETVARELDRHALPYVVVNRRPTGGRGTTVSNDDEGGMARAVEHLAMLGHRRIAHIAGPADVDTAMRRRGGYIRAMTEAGLALDPELIAEGPYSEEGGWSAMHRLFQLADPVTAVAASSLGGAVGAMAAIHAGGRRVPDDVSIVGFHDAPLAQYLNPPLSTVRMPLREMAETAVECLIRVLSGEAIADVVIPTPPMLVERASTARLP
jgi:DNA-binding LacI/PurR family transcriptional regulator